LARARRPDAPGMMPLDAGPYMESRVDAHSLGDISAGRPKFIAKLRPWTACTSSLIPLSIAPPSTHLQPSTQPCPCPPLTYPSTRLRPKSSCFFIPAATYASSNILARRSSVVCVAFAAVPRRGCSRAVPCRPNPRPTWPPLSTSVAMSTTSSTATGARLSRARWPGPCADGRARAACRS
jgi:hypothetical protein